MAVYFVSNASHCLYEGHSAMADWIEEGKKAPAFTLTADDGSKVRLADLAGKPVVVYFYPKDDTPGCTREACAFRDQSQELKRGCWG